MLYPGCETIQWQIPYGRYKSKEVCSKSPKYSPSLQPSETDVESLYLIVLFLCSVCIQLLYETTETFTTYTLLRQGVRG